MSKKDFIALADAIREHNRQAEAERKAGLHVPFTAFTVDQLRALTYFCKAQNPAFKTERWLDYIAGKCGKNGGKVAA